MKSVTPSDHLTFQTLQWPLLQRKLLQRVVEIAPAIKGRIQAVIKESQRADHVLIEIRMTCTVNEDSLDIYTLGDGQDKEKKQKKEKDEENSRKEIHNQKSSKLRLPFHFREETSPNHYSIVFKN